MNLKKTVNEPKRFNLLENRVENLERESVKLLERIDILSVTLRKAVNALEVLHAQIQAEIKDNDQ